MTQPNASPFERKTFTAKRLVAGALATMMLTACGLKEKGKEERGIAQVDINVGEEVNLPEGTRLFPTPAIIGPPHKSSPRPCAILLNKVEATVTEIATEQSLGASSLRAGFKLGEIFPNNPEVCQESPNGLVYAGLWDIVNSNHRGAG